MNCIICDKEMVPWLCMPLDPKTKKSTLGSRDFEFCNVCSLGSMSPLPNRETVPKFYDLKSYYTQADGHMPSVQPSLSDKVLTKLAYLIDNGEIISPEFFLTSLPKKPRALDIGAGGGDLLTKYRQLGWDAFGLEPDPKAKSHFLSEAISTYLGTAEEMPDQLARLEFDLISMTHVLEHSIDPTLALRNVFKLLKPGGTFWCEVPNSACTHFKRLNVCSEMFDAPRHIHFLDANSLTILLENAGFKIEKTYFHGFCRHHNPSWRAWEKGIHHELKKMDSNIKTKEHNYWESMKLLASNLFSSPEKKYDCIGVIAKRVK